MSSILLSKAPERCFFKKIIDQELNTSRLHVLARRVGVKEAVPGPYLFSGGQNGNGETFGPTQG